MEPDVVSIFNAVGSAGFMLVLTLPFTIWLVKHVLASHKQELSRRDEILEKLMATHYESMAGVTRSLEMLVSEVRALSSKKTRG